MDFTNKEYFLIINNEKRIMNLKKVYPSVKMRCKHYEINDTEYSGVCCWMISVDKKYSKKLENYLLDINVTYIKLLEDFLYKDGKITSTRKVIKHTKIIDHIMKIKTYEKLLGL